METSGRLKEAVWLEGWFTYDQCWSSTPPPPRCLSEAVSPLSGPKIQGIPTFEDYNGLISAFISNNRGKTFAWFLNPCYWETLPLGQRFFDDSEQIMHDWSLSWQTKGKYWKKNANMVKKKKKTGKKNWQQEQQTWPSPKLWTYNTGSFLEDAQEQAFFRKICSLCWTVQDGKQTSSKCSFLIVEGSFSIYKCQYYTLERIVSFNGLLIHQGCWIYEVLLGFKPRPTTSEKRSI